MPVPTCLYASFIHALRRCLTGADGATRPQPKGRGVLERFVTAKVTKLFAF